MPDTPQPTRLKLTRRQQDLLTMDVIEVGPLPEDARLVDEINAGSVTVNAALIKHLEEFADRDQDSNEQRVYKRLLRRARAALAAAEGSQP